MPVTPRGIVTPNAPDNYNLVVDLAAMGVSIDTAIGNALTGANVFKGTAAQRASFLATATVGQIWQDTDGIGMIWKKVGTAWAPAVWNWSGTSSQRSGFTQAPNGFQWYDTTEGAWYIREAGAWFLINSMFVCNTQGGTVTAGYTLITGWATPTATSSEFSFSGGVLTVNRAGRYMLSANVTTLANGVNSAIVLKNNTTVPNGALLSIQASGFTATGSVPVVLAAGDALRLYGAGPTASQSINQLSYLSLVRI